jgi:hypothetical protein
MTMSTSRTWSAYISAARRLKSSLISVAYPVLLPVVPASCSAAGTATYSPPSDRTCSATSGRTSVARTMAPSELAAPIAASPATPAPATSTLAGGTLPAAVTWPVKKRPNVCAASMTAR